MFQRARIIACKWSHPIHSFILAHPKVYSYQYPVRNRDLESVQARRLSRSPSDFMLQQTANLFLVCVLCYDMVRVAGSYVRTQPRPRADARSEPVLPHYTVRGWVGGWVRGVFQLAVTLQRPSASSLVTANHKDLNSLRGV